jgi:exopolyphosphatase / guanosine-5'-triphosphate,3'-diphosphate pyrophosphatase
MRLAYVLSAAMPGLLPKIDLVQTAGKTLLLKVPTKHSALMGERVEKRLVELANLMGFTPRAVIA